MDSPFTALDFERFIYRQGQLLASRDFRDQQRMEAARRWMHNTSALHNAWGVAVGYEFVLPKPADATAPAERQGTPWPADQLLTVQPGIAYDCYGRELILPQAVVYRRADLPAGSKLLLVASYQEAGSRPSSQLRCGGAPNSLPLPPPLLQWKPAAEVNYGPEVPLLVVIRGENGADMVHPYAAGQLHPEARPKMASGRTVAGQTAWRQWQVQIPAGSTETRTIPLGLEVAIDTTDAGFQQTPCYFAWFNVNLSIVIDDALATGASFLVHPFVSLADERMDGFTFRVYAPPIADRAGLDPVKANQYQLTACWLAIESNQPDLKDEETAPAAADGGSIGIIQ